ncbi:MAG: hypothetical protein HY706_11045 [Candidatus Hydrogenedentes bacterium]|nr:hypothetical protein [Candidatus Hydrogenedentota bacterium]
MKSDFEGGFLDDLSLRVEAEIASDYMGQAEQLLQEEQPGKFNHVPAAVLVGAVLEKALTTLCDQQRPPISTNKPDGKPKTLDPLITDLNKAGRYNEAKAKQVQSWAAVRNHAAHGEFDKFDRQVALQTLRFLSDYTHMAYPRLMELCRIKMPKIKALQKHLAGLCAKLETSFSIHPTNPKRMLRQFKSKR